ncbi:MAG TPA: DUF445 family protein [Clostridia bacterium]|nr:DUF445 family protein [Clostridia bacterium]
MNPALWIAPVTGALIGWFTNYLAVKMLFRPHEPVTIPLIGWTVQGVIPKRKKEIASSLGQVIAKELVSAEELAGQLSRAIQHEQLLELAAAQASAGVVKALPNLVPDPVKALIGNLVANLLQHQGPELVRQVSSQALTAMKENLDIAQLVEDKVNQMDWRQLEQLILRVSSRELKHIEVLGGVIGFLIGLVQLVVVHFTR